MRVLQYRAESRLEISLTAAATVVREVLKTSSANSAVLELQPTERTQISRTVLDYLITGPATLHHPTAGHNGLV